MRYLLLFFCCLCLPAIAAGATTPREAALYGEFRCMACQGETLADSNADLAIDMRAEIRRRIHEGASDAQIKDYFVSRYGDAILTRPPVQANTALLWLSPVLALILAAGAAFFYFRKSAPAEAPKA